MKNNSYRLLMICLCLLGGLGIGQAKDKPADKTNKAKRQHEIAIFAGGCYWCMQPPFDELKGVISTTVGYCGGKEVDPSYAQVSAGTTGHAESVRIEFDPQVIDYNDLLDVFWHNIDPTTQDAQFVDHGRQYRTAIFYTTPAQAEKAKASKAKWEKAKVFGQPIVTEITAATPFYAEKLDYHQKYYLKNPLRYKFYRFNSGRDQYLKRIWGKAPH